MSELIALLDAALKARTQLIEEDHQQAFRLFNGFLEGFPNLALDVYARTALIHNYSSMDGQDSIAEVLAWIKESLAWIGCVILKSRNTQNPAEKRGQLIFGSQPDIKIRENGVWYSIDLTMNRDASFYLDTRLLRLWARQQLTGQRILNTFAYTGSLGVAALAGGATRVVQLDRSRQFLRLATQSCKLNHLPVDQKDILEQDFFPAVGQLKRNGVMFDCVFLDPPFFASSNKGRVDLETGSTRLINKVRPLIVDGGRLVAINNALFVSGQEYLASLQALCADGYLEIEQFIPVPDDYIGYAKTAGELQPTDPAPFNHSTKIALLRIRRKQKTQSALINV